MRTTARSIIALLLVPLLLVSARTAQQTQDSAHLAVGYTFYRISNGKVEQRRDPRTILVVCLEHWIQLDPIKDGSAFSLFDTDSGTGPIGLELIDYGGISVPTGAASGEAFSWVLLVAKDGEVLRTDGNYEFTIHYERLSTWAEAEDDNGDAVVTPTTVAESIALIPIPLPVGKKVSNYGELQDADGDAKLDGPNSRAGIKGFIDDLDIELTPQVAEGSSDIAITYKLGYELERRSFGGSTPGNLTLDFAVEGRSSTDSAPDGLNEYTRGAFSARGMWLLGSERYYPVGARLAAGYEGGDSGSESGGTITAQVVASVPYIGDILELWQEILGFERAFAPPFVSLAYIGSGAEVGTAQQDRWEFEAGWIAPVAEAWDVNVLWQRHNFTHRGVQDENLLELDLTYYPAGDLSQGLRLSFEEGYRAAVGDIGSVVLLGYMVSM